MRTSLSCRLIACTLACLSTLAVLATSARADVPPPNQPVDHGFVLRASLGGKANLFATGLTGSSGSLPAGASLEVGMMAGYKFGRATLGLNLGFLSVSSSSSGSSSSSSVSSLVLGPELQVALWRSLDRRAEILGGAGLGFGHYFLSSSSPSSNNFHLTYQLGPGVRFWAHPHVALEALTGFSGDVLFLYNSGSNQTLGSYGVFAMLGVLGAI